MNRKQKQKLESEFQSNLIHRLGLLFPGCLVLINDSADRPGIADLTLLYKEFGALLEVKRSSDAVRQPNQDYYLNQVTHGYFICPENVEEVLYELQCAFKS